MYGYTRYEWLIFSVLYKSSHLKCNLVDYHCHMSITRYQSQLGRLLLLENVGRSVFIIYSVYIIFSITMGNDLEDRLGFADNILYYSPMYLKH